MTERYDAIVVGGGPAGSTAAGFLAKNGRRVVVLEREAFPRYHVGESLLPSTTLGILGKLGLSETLEAQGFMRKLGGTFVWGKRPEPWSFRFYRTAPEDHAIGDDGETLHSFQVERSVFDELLLDHAAELGAEVHQQARVVALEGLEEAEKTVRVRIDGRERRVHAPYVVDASGRNSPIRTNFGERHYDPFFKNLAIYRYYDGGGRLGGDAAGDAFAVAFDQGWFWYIPLRQELTSVGLVVSRAAYDERRGEDPAAVFDEMVPKAPRIASLLEGAQPSERPPYDRVRVEADYSYIHSAFTHAGVFLAGDSACFIDPVFSSGVHLATYAGYLAAKAIDALRSGSTDWSHAARSYEDAYRREYSAFYRFLVSFYQMHHDADSYFWEAHKIVGDDTQSAHDAFISIVSGQATAGATLFGSREDLVEQVDRGERSLGALVTKVSGEDVADDVVDDARSFMTPIHEGRHRIIREE